MRIDARKIVKQVEESTGDWSTFFEANGWPQLPLRKKPCHDCAVTTGFYRPYAKELKRCSIEVRVARSGDWFCHNDRRLACRGNAAFQGSAVLHALKARSVEREAKAGAAHESVASPPSTREER